MNAQNKPLIVEIEEAKTELIQCTNDILKKHGVGCYLLEPVFAEVYAQIKTTARNELAQAMLRINNMKADGCDHEGCDCGCNNK